MPEDTTKLQSQQCPHIEKCSFFIKNENELADLCEKLKKDVCLQDNTHCARLRTRNALGPESVPVLMMPNQHEWADQILLDAGKNLSEYPGPCRKRKNRSL